MNVLVAIDGMPHSEKAVQYAIEYAIFRRATLFIVFVVNHRPDEDRESVIKKGMMALEEAKKNAMEKGVSVTTMLEAGSPYEAILSIADRISAESIIVGASKKTVLDKVIKGSVSEFVVRNAKCTVIVVR
jgi:nucleotide-binding universal stress UspA family protein